MKGSADSGITETEKLVSPSVEFTSIMVPGVTSKLCTPKFDTGQVFSILTKR